MLQCSCTLGRALSAQHMKLLEQEPPVGLSHSTELRPHFQRLGEKPRHCGAFDLSS